MVKTITKNPLSSLLYQFKEWIKKLLLEFLKYILILKKIAKKLKEAVFLGNNVYINMFGVLRVYHGYKKISWSEYKGHKYLTDYPTYPYNKKEL